ncbi:lipopolysaccharide biosynthesis protein [Luteimonas sp. MJ250]|uniref:lipopolysaccharide biosynthesis protein n=1 Tax=Luteimonas sp. MJ250 TaxID=3129236 RepID=UPI0031BB77FB
MTIGRSNEELAHVDSSKVGSLARKGAVWSVIQIVVRNVVSIGSTAMLARLLAPDDYGLIGMVATLTALLLVFSDMGLSWATIQRRELTQAQVSNLFWINVGAGLALWLACSVVAPVMAQFYEREELRLVTMVLGASFLVGGLSVQPFALLKRRMDFRTVARIEIAAGVVAAVTAIACALAGLGYWALVIQGLAGQLARAALSIPASRIRLQAPAKDSGTRSMVGFGGLLAVNGLLIYLSRNLDSVMIGKVWGTEQLGYYDRAYFLMLLPSMLATGALANLMVPSLSALQDERERFGDAYRRALRMVAFVGCPMAAGLALVAPEAVRLVYGEKWLPVVPILVWLSLAGITQPIYNTTGWLFTAAGKAKLYFAVTLLNAIALTIAFYWGVKKGAVGVAMAYGVTMGLVLLWPAMWVAHRAAGLRLIQSVKELLPIMVAVAGMGVAAVLAGKFAEQAQLGWGWVLSAKIVVGVLVYGLLASVLLSQVLRRDLYPMLPARLRKGQSA